MPYLLGGAFAADTVASMRLSQVLIAAWTLLSAAQWLVAARHFDPEGLLSWERLSRLSDHRWKQALRRRMRPPVLRGLLAAQLMLALLLAVVAAPIAAALCLAGLIGCHLFLVLLAGEYWVDGSDKIGLIAMIGTLGVALGLVARDPGVALAGILLVGGQVAVCYGVAGVSKLFVPGWRRGAWLQSILATESWGNQRLPALFRTGGVAVVASWAVIVVEALFPLALLAPEPWLLIAMAAMLAFHLSTAIVMGLNKFPLAFAATYPALFVLGRVVRHTLGLGG